jgi:hypothetical protein
MAKPPVDFADPGTMPPRHIGCGEVAFGPNTVERGWRLIRKKAGDIVHGIFDSIRIRERVTEGAMQTAQCVETRRIVERVEQITQAGAISAQMFLGRGNRIKAGLTDIRGVGVEHVCLPCMHERCWWCLFIGVMCAAFGRSGERVPFSWLRSLVLVLVLVKRTLVVLLRGEEEICRAVQFIVHITA